MNKIYLFLILSIVTSICARSKKCQNSLEWLNSKIERSNRVNASLKERVARGENLKLDPLNKDMNKVYLEDVAKQKKEILEKCPDIELHEFIEPTSMADVLESE